MGSCQRLGGKRSHDQHDHGVRHPARQVPPLAFSHQDLAQRDAAQSKATEAQLIKASGHAADPIE